MNTYQFEQLVYCSSQKSIVTENPGFGIRTKSAGLTNAEAEDIVSAAKVNYAVPMEQRATRQLIEEHPQLDELYPPLYTYKKIQLSNGDIKYIVARTVYVGIDYGYFARIEGAHRDGANYIAHVLVFNEPIPPTVLLHAIQLGVFLPQNMVCSPENEDICSYLIGEPTVLTAGEIQVEEEPNHTLTEQIGWLITALLQAYKNQRTDEYAKKIIYKSNQEQILQLLPIFGVLPKNLIKDVYFQINNMEAYNVPIDLNIQFINEKSQAQIASDYCITVDTLQKPISTSNIEENFLFAQVHHCCEVEDFQMLETLIDMFCEFDFSQTIDYETAYNSMILARTSEPLLLESYTPKQLENILDTSLLPQDKTIIEKKINEAINGELAIPKDIKNYKKRIEIIDTLRNSHPNVLHLEATSGNRLMEVLFETEENDTLPSLEKYCDCLIYILEKADCSLPEEEKFLQVISKLHEKKSWLTFIKYYYSEIPLASLLKIEECILQSKTEFDKFELIEEILNSKMLAARNASTIANALQTLWQKVESETEKDYIINLFRKITNKQTAKMVMENITDQTFYDALNQNSTFQKRILNQVKKMFPFVSKFLCLLCVIAFSACKVELKKSKPYCNPFQAVVYSLPTTNVAQVEEITYDEKKKKILAEQYSIDKLGRINYYQSIRDNDTVAVNYDYRNKKLKNIISSDVDYTLDGDKYELSSLRAFEKGTNTQKSVTTYSYGKNGELKRTVEYENDEKTFYDYTYFPDMHLQTLTITSSANNNKIVFEFDQNKQRPINRKDYGGKKQKLQASYTYVYFSEDKYGNWQSAICKNAKGKAVRSYDRKYKYFSDIENEKKQLRRAAEMTSYTMQNLSDNKIINYFKNIPYRFKLNNYSHNTPSLGLTIFLAVLLIGFIFLLVHLAKKYNLLQGFSGRVQPNGMKRTWMFNKEAYLDVLVIAAVLLLAFMAVLATMCVIGAITFAILWVFKVLLIVLVWIGWIALIGGGLYLYAAQDGPGCITVLVGGVIVIFRNVLKDLGQNAVDWGFDFMSNLNVFGWGLSVITNFWDVILMTVTTPLVIFFSAAFVIILCVFLLMGFEKIVMSLYDIRRPCPVCGSTKTPEYWIDEYHKHPVALHPGFYGVFHQTNPDTGEKLPTMIFNGKGKLLRKCTNCHSFMRGNTQGQSTVGTEKHIGVVGHRSSGKSYLLYSGLHELIDHYPTISAHQDFDRDTSIGSNYERIRKGAGIQTDVKDAYRAIQLMIEHKPVAYHIYFYDVAGEMFNQRSTSYQKAMTFYKNVQSIIFIVDPTMIDTSGGELSDEMENWLKKQPRSEQFSLDNIYSSMQTILMRAGNNTKHLHLTFVCTKADMGYLEACGYNQNISEKDIEQFMKNDLRLGNIINAAKSSFKDVHFEIASVQPSYIENMRKLFVNVLKQLGVNIG